MKTNDCATLVPGAVALRFRVEWRGQPARPALVGTQAVQVVAVDGDRVTWTNGRRSRAGGMFRHTCDRRELLDLDSLSPESNAPLPAMAALPVGATAF